MWCRYILLLFSFLLCASSVCAQDIITTVAGGGVWVFPGDGGPATDAPLGNVARVAVDPDGNVFASDSNNHIVVKISPGGDLTVVAGNGTAGFSGDGGPATSASLNFPAGVAVDAVGNLYIADAGNARVRKVDGTGTITTVAGNGAGGFSGDGGPVNSASLSPVGIALDAVGNLYIADNGNNRVRKVDGTGTITTVAGDGTCCFSGDGGPATSTSINNPSGVAFDVDGNLLIADTFNSRVRQVSPDGIITTIAGNGVWGFSGDGGPATEASLGQFTDVATDAAGNLYIADSTNHRVRKVSPDGTITTVAGKGLFGFSGDGGPATEASLSRPTGVAVDAAGNLYVADTQHWRVRKVSRDGTITTFAGNGSFRFSGDDGPATSATLTLPLSVAVNAVGELFIADTGNHRVRKVSPDGAITTVAGKGLFGFSGDGEPATEASLSWPNGVAADAAGNLYISDNGNNRVRKVDGTGTITTVAGNGTADFSGDGCPATEASLSSPASVAVDAAGNLYIAADCRVRKVDPGGIIDTVIVGSLLSSCFRDMTVDGDDNLYVVAVPIGSLGGGSGHILKLSPAGEITTAARILSSPSGVAVDPAGNLYVSDFSRVLKIFSGNVQTEFAGFIHRSGFDGDGGPATDASLQFPRGLALDADGNLYIADTRNDRIRKVTVSSPGMPSIGGVVDGARFSNLPPAAGSIGSLFGSNFASSPLTAGSVPLPASLGGVSVQINGVDAPLFFVSSEQINFQFPWDLGGQTEASFTVTANGVTSAPQTVALAPFRPGIFAINSQGTGQGAVLIANTALVAAPSGSIPGGAARPASRGEFLSIFCTGLGAVMNPPANGAPAMASPLSTTIETPSVFIGDKPATVTFSGLAPGFVGLYQVNVQVPENAPTGDAVRVILRIGFNSSNVVTIAVE